MILLITNSLLGLFANAVRFFAIKRFIDIFLSKDECQFIHMWILYIIACLWTSLIYVLFMSPALNIISNIVAFFLLVFPYKAKISRKILIILLIYAINCLVDSLVVISLTEYVIGEPVEPVYECITSLIILIIAIVLERTISAERDIFLPVFYRIMLGSVPIISVVCIYYMVITALNLKLTVIVAAACILFINIIIFYLYDSLVKFYSDRLEKKLLEQMIEVYANQLELVQESQERIKALRHDMKHHIIELSAMVRKEKKADVINYLQEMERFMLNPDEHVSTGNEEIDGVLNYLLQKADGILEHMDIKINIPEKSFGANFSICVILGNLVDNAIRESCRSEEKYLKLNIQTKQGILLIFIENSYSGTIVKHDNKFASAQVNPSIHGIGLDNVKKIVKAHGGDIDVDYTENRFRVHVLMYL